MASDRSQFNRALRRWDALHDEGSCSHELADGQVAILCSEYGLGTELIASLEVEAFEEEAREIGSQLSDRGVSSRIFRKFSLDDAAEALEDPEFSSIVVIGNGNLSEACAENGDSFDWRFVSEYATHLKLGRFTQRHCGQLIRSLSVPLGTFAMHDHSNVFAGHNVKLPTSMSYADEHAIQRLHNQKRLGYRAVQNLFTEIFIEKRIDISPVGSE